MQISKIYKGWKTYLSGENPDFVKERAKICAGCRHAVLGVFEKWLPETKELKQIQGLKCDVCHCPLSAKLRSEDDHCELKKW